MNLKKLSVSFIIPNFNGRDLLDRLLPRLLTIYPDAEVIVVDDNSADNSSMLVKQSYKQVRLIQKKQTTGFGSTCNLGAKQAKGEILVFLNTDILPRQDFLKPVLDHFNNPKLFAVGFCDLSHENNKIIKRGSGGIVFKKGFLLHYKKKTDLQKTAWVSGGSGAFRKDIFLKMGGFNELYDPFYWEDIDLSYRALKSGFQLLFEPKAEVDHFHKQGSIAKNFKDWKIKTISYRNQLIFVWKNITGIKYLANHFFWLPYHLILTTVKTRGQFLMGFLAAILKIPCIIKSRSQQKKLYQLKDEQIIQA
jgi:GT2 family glycosyltransferase